MKNLSFEDGWVTLPPTGSAGWLQNQRPVHWQLAIMPIGAELWDSADKVTGEPECVHKLVEQLPPDEQPDGSDPLILDGEVVYKVFHSGAAYGVELRQVVEGLKPDSEATAVIRVRVHDHKGTDHYGAEMRMTTNGKGGWWHKTAGQLVNFKWVTRQQVRTIGDDGRFELVIQLKTKYSLPVDWFLDAFEFTGEYADTEPPVDPPPIDPPPPTDHDHPDIDAQLSSLQTQYDALAVMLAGIDARVTAVEAGQPQPPEMPTLPPRVLAVDVSAHQGAFDWIKAKAAGIRYAVLRSSNGLGSSSTDENGRDVQLLANAAKCTRLGIPFSIYHFLQPGDTTEQAGLVETIYEELISNDTPPTGARLDNGRILPPVWCDIESFDLNITAVKLFCELLDAGIYTSGYYWNVISGNVAAWWADTPLWAAHWTGNNSGQIPGGTAVPILPCDFNQADLWQFTSKGGPLVGWSGGLDVNLTGPFTAVIPPPTGETIDMLPYLRGPDKIQYDTDAKLFTQTYQYRHDGNLWRLVKGGQGQYECYYYDANYIYRREDTSQGNDKFYVHLTDGVPGAPWLKRRMKVGETAVFTKQVQHYWSDCTERLPLATATDSIKLIARHSDYTFPTTGKTLQDVIELAWLEGGERYWFARGFGLVGFTDSGIVAEFMDGPLPGRADLPIKPPGCVDLNPRHFG